MCNLGQLVASSPEVRASCARSGTPAGRRLDRDAAAPQKKRDDAAGARRTRVRRAVLRAAYASQLSRVDGDSRLWPVAPAQATRYHKSDRTSLKALPLRAKYRLRGESRRRRRDSRRGPREQLDIRYYSGTPMSELTM